jgi:hypothetical protein
MTKLAANLTAGPKASAGLTLFLFSSCSGYVSSGTMILSRWPIVDSDYLRFSLNGNVHQITKGDAMAGAGVGLAAVKLRNGMKANLCVSHYHAEYNRWV